MQRAVGFAYIRVRDLVQLVQCLSYRPTDEFSMISLAFAKNSQATVTSTESLQFI